MWLFAQRNKEITLRGDTNNVSYLLQEYFLISLEDISLHLNKNGLHKNFFIQQRWL